MTVDFQQLRVKMVDGQVRTTDVTDTAILAAMLTVPRELFVPDQRRELAYIDEDIEVQSAGEGREARFLMEPSPFAKLLQLAEVRKSDKVLDIACGTGYSAAVLLQIAGSVVALESDAGLAAKTRELVSGVEVIEGDLAKGHAAGSPYDVIFINGAVDEVPAALFDQLADGGRLVAVVGVGNAARATLYLKEDGLVSGRSVFNASIKPLSAFDRAPAFVF
jgi:protein-L-isoaspartate(D-aspartate) O-methyltransferase